jgi:hypothetical protein
MAARHGGAVGNAPLGLKAIGIPPSLLQGANLFGRQGNETDRHGIFLLGTEER